MRRSRGTSPMARVSALTAGAALLAGGLLASSPASAHDRLLSSDPATDAALTAPPDEVTLTYSNEVAREYVEAAVAAPGGPLVPVPPEDIGGTGAAVVLDIADTAAGAPAGEWSVVVRIVSADGHPVESVLGFEAGAGTAPLEPVEPPPSPPAGPVADVSPASPAPRLDGTAAAAPSTDAAALASGEDVQGLLGGSPVLLAGGVLAAVVLLAAGLVAIARRR